MSYRHLDNIDEKIIDATILVGSTNGANKLSTKEIAKSCDISEFVIYDHFRSKEKLLSAADHKVTALLNEMGKKFIDEGMDFDHFYNAMIDYLLSVPNYTSFLINYGHLFPRTSKPEDFDEFLQNELFPTAKAYLEKIGIHYDRDYLYAYNWMWLGRCLLTYAQFIIGKSLEDKIDVRATSCGFAKLGALAFQKKGE
jgi:AcrR family transcriptional regulator